MSSFESINRFRRRVKSQGDTAGEAITNHTEQYLERTFKDSPSYKLSGVESSQYPDIKTIDTRVVSVERMGSLREIIFKPKEFLDIGSYLVFDNSKWLIYDAFTNTVSPKVIAQKCNEILKWKETLESGEVVEHSYSVVSGASDLGSKAKQSRSEVPYNKLDIREPIGQLFIYVESNEFTNTLEVDKRLIIGDRVYKVVGKDGTTLTSDLIHPVHGYNYGIVYFIMQLDTMKPKDDFVENIASDLRNNELSDWGN